MNPFLVAARHVFQAETGTHVERGPVTVENSPLLSDDVTVLVGVSGRLFGIVLYNMSERTAKRIVGTLMREPVQVFDSLAESAVAEMGNMITGRASMELEQLGYPVILAPPSLVVGRNTIISPQPVSRLVILLETGLGDVAVHVALREAEPGLGRAAEPEPRRGGAKPPLHRAIVRGNR